MFQESKRHRPDTSHQVSPERPLFLQKAFSDTTSATDGNLLLNLKQDKPDEFRCGTNVLYSDHVHYVYVTRKYMYINVGCVCF